MQKSGVWIAVLLIHIFLWIALTKNGETPPSSRLNIVPIVLNVDESTRALQLIKSSPKDVSERSAISPKLNPLKQHSIQRGGTPQRQKIIQKTSSNKHAKQALINSERVAESPESYSQVISNQVSKQIKTLNYDAMKQIVREIAHEPAHRSLPGTDKQLSKSERFASAVDHAKRGDCRSEHAHLGILAIPFLLKDAITDEGCKW